ncbi:MAG: GNAT family N-acetyltransferase [Blastocatellia bacterium]
MRFDFVVEPLGKKHQRQTFDCGEESLNQFLKNYARQNNEKHLGKTFVAVYRGETEVYGYYMLSSGSIFFETVPENLPRYPLPTVYLGRLAVDTKMRRNGLGEFLLTDALRRIVLVSEDISIYAIELFALNSAAKSFYQKYGFLELKDNDHHLYLPMTTLRKLGLV